MKKTIILLISIFMFSMSSVTLAKSENKIDLKRKQYVQKIEKSSRFNFDEYSFQKLRDTFKTEKDFNDYINKEEIYHIIEKRDLSME
tara:strand:- start:163165 stop:163425 length:261 start_codon:yes stop_codon:yes gene_type:complete